MGTGAIDALRPPIDEPGRPGPALAARSRPLVSLQQGNFMFKIAKPLLLLLLLVLLLACGLAQAQELDARARQQLPQAAEAVGRAIRAHDLVALDKLWSPKLLVNSPDNSVLTRDQVFGAIKAGMLDYEQGTTFELERAEFYGNVAVTMGEDTYTPTFGPEKGKRLHRRATNIWQYSDGAWVLIARQATIYDPAVKHY
ncbi:nuclear transport factor 2 family protein [Pseudoxanthomonas composti]|uniref:Nuclear transport factor 2 family protein n=2 Tax=Pseudoxanthomonas composti TaxID=2137479 RepID=A0A4Q1JZ79_9GAMM|nr:nuclear transport factor 2 family protein [Pseudoxanthomonas composti]